MDWNSAGPAAVVGAIAATVGVMLLELALKPAFARKRVATILVAEARLNVRGMKSIVAMLGANPEAVPENVVLSTLGWKAVSAEVHYLPAHAIDELLLRYSQFNEINGQVQRYSHKVDLILRLTPDSPPLYAVQTELAHESKTFAKSVPHVLAATEQTIEMLQAIVDAGPPTGIANATDG